MLFKSRDPLESSTIPKEDTNVPKKLAKIDLAKSTPEQIATYAADLEKSLADTEEELEKAKFPPKAKKKPAPGADEDDEESPFAKDDEATVEMKKSINLMKSQVETLQAELVIAKSTATAAQVDVKKAQDAAELITFEKMVEKDLPKIPGTVTEIAKMLQEAKSTLTAASYAVLEKGLKAGSEAIAKAATEVGGAGNGKVGSAEEEIFKSADALVAAGTFKTRPEAVVHVQKTNTDLAERYRIEKSVSRR